MKFAVFSDKGNHRETNEDNYIIQEISSETALIAVADGMGGHQAGEVASQLAVNFLQDYQFDLESNIIKEMEQVINTINHEIIKQAHQNDEYDNMGTTLSLGLINQNKLFFGHVGDSRIYLFRDDDLQQLTTDDTLVQQLVQQGKIKPEDAFNNPRSHILTQGLGVEYELDIQTDEIKLQAEDILLFCTDGLSDMIRGIEIEKMLQDMSQIDQLTEKLGEMALDNGGKDNITVITGIIN